MRSAARVRGTYNSPKSARRVSDRTGAMIFDFPHPGVMTDRLQRYVLDTSMRSTASSNARLRRAQTGVSAQVRQRSPRSSATAAGRRSIRQSSQRRTAATRHCACSASGLSPRMDMALATSSKMMGFPCAQLRSTCRRAASLIHSRDTSKRSSACSSRSCAPRTSGPSHLWTTLAC